MFSFCGSAVFCDRERPQQNSEVFSSWEQSKENEDLDYGYTVSQVIRRDVIGCCEGNTETTTHKTRKTLSQGTSFMS